MSLNTKRLVINLKVRLSKLISEQLGHFAGDCFHTSILNVYVHQDRQRRVQIYAISHIHPPTHKQTIKVHHFLLTSKLKLSFPKRIILSEWCVLMTASSHEYEMQTRPEGHYCLPLNHYQLILSYKSSFSFSQSVFFSSVSGGLLILAPFTLG